MVEKYTVTARFDGTVYDNLKAAGFSRAIVTQLRKQLGLIRVLRRGQCGEGEAVFAVADVSAGDSIFLTLPVNAVRYPEIDIQPEFAYIDDDIAVVVKPSGIATVPLRSHYGDSLAGVLGNAFGEFVYRPVGRLDKDTSGLIIIARNALSASLMREIQIAGKIDKTYTALVEGIIPEQGEINAPVALAADGIHREVSDNGKPALTLFRRIGVYGNDSLVEFRLLTGRTHQIRVHSAYIGHPVCGDTLYGFRPDAAPRLMLHCSGLFFPHPITGKMLTAENPFRPFL